MKKFQKVGIGECRMIYLKRQKRCYVYVRDIYSTILIRDLVEKYKIRNKSEFTNIAAFMMDNS